MCRKCSQVTRSRSMFYILICYLRIYINLPIQNSNFVFKCKPPNKPCEVVFVTYEEPVINNIRIVDICLKFKQRKNRLSICHVKHDKNPYEKCIRNKKNITSASIAPLSITVSISRFFMQKLCQYIP